MSNKKKNAPDMAEEQADAMIDEAAEMSETEAVESEDLAAEAEQKYVELNDRYLRLLAEYENYRKRSTREKVELYPQTMASAVEKFLPVLDNLERAIGFEKTTEEFAKGFDMICQSFADVLKALGVEEIGAVGESFNPEFHNAVMHIEDETLGENVISQVMQKGYKIGDRVIRYAMVQTAN